MLTDDDARRYFSRVGFAVFALIAVNVGTQFLLALLLQAFAPWIFSYEVASYALSFVPLYGAAVPVFYLILRGLPAIRPLATPMRTRDWFGGLCMSVAAMLVGNYVSQILISGLDVLLRRSLENPVESMTVGMPWWLNLVFVGILAPILEELVFRKLLCRHLLPLGEGYAIVLSAVIFGLAHGNFFQFLYAFAMGLIFALVYVKTGKIIYSILYHAVINILGGVFAPWLTEQLRLEELTAVLEQISETLDPTPILEFVFPLTLLLVYDLVMYAAAIIGIVLFFRSRKKYTLEAGLLPPPKKGRVGNIFLNAGVALALAAFAVTFILSLLP